MAPIQRDVQLASISPRSDDLEDVRLLDSVDAGGGGGGGGDEEEGEAEEKRLRKIGLRVTGMTCSACTSAVESAVNAVNGVVKASVSLLQNKAYVVFDPNFVKVSLIFVVIYCDLREKIGVFLMGFFCLWIWING